MGKTLRIAARNLLRYRRRTLLTALLITIGIVAALLFVSVTASFKTTMVGSITDSMLGHVEIHRKGYVASVDSLPLNLHMPPPLVAKVDAVLETLPQIAAHSRRVKFGAMFSNFIETTSVRLNGIDAQREDAAVPGLRQRIIEGSREGPLVNSGEVLIPDLLAKGMKLKVGDTVVLVATNQQGSVNGKTFVVRGVLEPVTGPSGRDGYIPIDDARELLRLEKPEVSEIVIRLHDPDALPAVHRLLEERLADIKNKQGQAALEAHTWEGLSPFANIVRMIDMMTLFIKIMLVSIVLVSVMNVMLMAVFERIREIGTISAIGTPPGRILGLFVGEGLLLGIAGSVVGIAVSLVSVYALNVFKVSFAFGRQHFTLAPTLAFGDIAAVSLMVIAVAVLASLQPAWKASRMDPITALRHV